MYPREARTLSISHLPTYTLLKKTISCIRYTRFIAAVRSTGKRIMTRPEYHDFYRQEILNQIVVQFCMLSMAWTQRETECYILSKKSCCVCQRESKRYDTNMHEIHPAIRLLGFLLIADSSFRQLYFSHARRSR